MEAPISVPPTPTPPPSLLHPPISAPPTQKRYKKKRRKAIKTMRRRNYLPPVKGPQRSLTPSLGIETVGEGRNSGLRKTATFSDADQPSPWKRTEAIPEASPPETASEKHSLLISIKNYKLPTRFPERFETFGHFKNDKGEEIPLLHRDVVAKKLMELNKDVQPILHNFKVYYSALSEGHPQWSKAAITNRIPLKFSPPVKAFAHHIQLRIRNRSSPNDPCLFYNRSTLLAILFHELAHIRHMNHGSEFMLFLRDIYKYAGKIGVFRKGERHQLPSCRKWENFLFAKGGAVTDEELGEFVKRDENDEIDR